MEIVRTENLTKSYGKGETLVRALYHVNISVQDGEFAAIVGSSGSGKTTLLNMLGGLDYPTEGSIIIRNQVIEKLKPDERTVFRRRNIGFIFQNYNLMPVLNVYENIVLPLKLDGLNEDSAFLNEIIGVLKLEDKLDRMPETLSGGQQQRVAIARALASKPAVILADEPTGNLDSRSGMEVAGLLKTSARKFHQTVLVVTHNEEIAQMAERMIRIENGEVQEVQLG